MSQNDKKEHSSSRTEAWADTKAFDPETNVSIPSDEAVEDAKDWVDSNEK